MLGLKKSVSYSCDVEKIWLWYVNDCDEKVIFPRNYCNKSFNFYISLEPAEIEVVWYGNRPLNSGWNTGWINTGLRKLSCTYAISLYQNTHWISKLNYCLCFLSTIWISGIHKDTFSISFIQLWWFAYVSIHTYIHLSCIH